MPRTCSVCQAPERQSIDEALIRNTTAFRALGRQFGLSRDALARHRGAHLITPLADNAPAAEEARQALDVVKQLKAINNATLTVLAQARASGDGDLVLRAVDRVQRQIELQAKLLGELDERPVVNILLNPQWQQLVVVLRRTLAPHPIILAEVSAALEDAARAA